MRQSARIATLVTLGMGVFATAAAAQSPQKPAEISAMSATHTSLTAETREVAGHTVAIFRATVLSSGGKAATGAVTLVEQGHSIAGAALGSEGVAEFRLDSLTAGDHSMRAIYNGDASSAISQSSSVLVHPQATAAPDFSLAIAPASLTEKAGNSGSLVATVTPSDGFTGFLSLSCSGAPITSGAAGGTSLPVGVACTFTPANLQVVAATTANPTGAVTAQMVLQTTSPAGQLSLLKQSNGLQVPASHGTRETLALAFLLPGAFGLAFLGRKRKALKRAALLLSVTAMCVLGASACNPRYGYLHHAPTANEGTPTGTYSLTVTAQSNNGVTAVTHSQPLALTVQ